MRSTVNKLRGKIPPANANANIDADALTNAGNGTEQGENRKR